MIWYDDMIYDILFNTYLIWYDMIWLQILIDIDIIWYDMDGTSYDVCLWLFAWTAQEDRVRKLVRRSWSHWMWAMAFWSQPWQKLGNFSCEDKVESLQWQCMCLQAWMPTTFIIDFQPRIDSDQIITYRIISHLISFDARMAAWPLLVPVPRKWRMCCRSMTSKMVGGLRSISRAGSMTSQSSRSGRLALALGRVLADLIFVLKVLKGYVRNVT